MSSLKRYVVVIDRPLRGQEGLPPEEVRYATLLTKDKFSSREEAVAYATRMSEDIGVGIPETKVNFRARLFTLDVVDLEEIRSLVNSLQSV